MKNKIYLETERTYLREFTIDDALDFYNLNLDPEVLKYTGDHAFDTIEDAKSFLSGYDQYRKYGVGRLAVIDKQTNKFIGWCGLKYCPDRNEYDIGFRFFKEYWNQGFATETAKECIEFGFETIKMKEIVGRAMKENKASVKVLEKIGMKFKGDINFEGQEGVIYNKTRPD